MVIVLVETRRSVVDVCEINLSNTSGKLGAPVGSEALPGTLGRISFAIGPVHSKTDDEAESQRSRVFQSQGGQENRPEQVILEVKESHVGLVGDCYHYRP